MLNKQYKDWSLTNGFKHLSHLPQTYFQKRNKILFSKEKIQIKCYFQKRNKILSSPLGTTYPILPFHFQDNPVQFITKLIIRNV